MNRFSRWLGGLRVGRKLLLIYLLDLSAVIYVSGILIHEKYLAIDFARKEIVGVTYASAVSEVLMGAVLPPTELFAGRRQALQDLRSLRLTTDAELGLVQISPGFVAAAEGLPMAPTEPRRHAEAVRALIAQGRALMTAVGNQSNLILDPDLDSYYVMSLTVLRYTELLQVMFDATQQLTSRRTAGNGSSERNTQLLIVAGRLDAVLQGVGADFAQAVLAGSPELNQALAPLQRELDEQGSRLVGALRQRVDTGPAANDEQALGRVQAGLLRAIDQAWQVGWQQLDGLLRARVLGQFQRMWLHLGTALLLLSCILTLVYLVARQIASPLRALAAVADGVRQSGDYSRRADWQSRDEIGSLVTAFNDMLAQLDQNRALQQELAASSRAALAQQQLVEAIPIALVVTSIPDHDVLHANPPALAWIGDSGIDPWRHGLEPGVRNRLFQRLADAGSVDEFEVRWLGGAEPAWAVLSARRLTFMGTDAMLTAFTPINVLKLMEQRMALWAKVFEASSEGIIIMDAQQRILSVNQAFCRSTGYGFYEVVGETLRLLLGPQQAQRITEFTSGDQQKPDDWQGEVNVLRRAGGSYPAWLMISAVREPAQQNAVSHYIGLSVDITDRKRTEARVQFLAQHDVLTELPNRSLCLQRLAEALEQARQSGGLVAVLFIDLDRFKIINDTLGHHIGDGLLRAVAHCLNQSVRNVDTVSRLGGDEFVIVLRSVASVEEVRQLIERRLIALIRQPHLVDGHALRVSCSVGVAMYPQDGDSVDELMREADLAMYEAKSAGRDMVRFYLPELDLAAQQRQTMEQHLRAALGHNEFSVCLQPKLSATGLQVLGAEMLLRWNNPELGAVSPEHFIPLAEETGLILPIGAWVFEQACQQSVRWRDAGLTDMGIAVNLSTVQLADPDLVPTLRACLARSGCDPAALEIEITESHLMDNALVAEERLLALKELGVALSIDDFGTGYSSLAYLKRFPIDRLKIDQSFVRDMQDDPTDLAITQAIIALGHTLGLTVVAEGVERQQQVEHLQALGCDELQGYYFARPMSEAEFDRWLNDPARPGERRRLPNPQDLRKAA